MTTRSPSCATKWRKGAFTGLIHCFTGTQRLADAALELGLYISVSGIATFKNSAALRDVIKTVPLDRLLVETDAPFLAPVPHRGKTNEPAFVVHTAAMLAELKGVSARRAGRAPRPRISSACSPKCSGPHDALEVRILGCGSSGRRAAAGRSGRRGLLGRLRSRQSQEPPPPLLHPGARRNRQAAKPACWSTPRPTCASSCWRRGVGRLDGVLITHDHADQLHGIDDLRVIAMNMRKRLDVWSDRTAWTA